MSRSMVISEEFHGVARQEQAGRQPKVRPERGPAPFSLRLSTAERERLKAAAGSKPLGAYIRAKLLGDLEEVRRSRRQPIEDHEKLAAVLAALGRSHLASNMNQIAKAGNAGSLPLTLEVVEQVLEACAHIRDMREALILALGIKPQAGD